MRPYIEMIKPLKDMHSAYQEALRQGANIGNKKLISAWKNADGIITSGQYFEKKKLPNGNIKTRIVTIYDNNAKSIGLETIVSDRNRNLIYKSIGIVKDTTHKLRRKIGLLMNKTREGCATQQEEYTLANLMKRSKLNTKMYVCQDKLAGPRKILYEKLPDDAKTLSARGYKIYGSY